MKNITLYQAISICSAKEWYEQFACQLCELHGTRFCAEEWLKKLEQNNEAKLQLIMEQMTYGRRINHTRST